MKTRHVVCCLVAGFTLCAGTAILPLVSAPPAFLALNMAGIALVSYGVGPLAGGLFGAVTHLASNSFGMGSGVIGYILLTRLVEGVLPGAIDTFFRFRPRFAWFSPLVGAAALTLLIKPLSTILAWMCSPYAGNSPFFPWIVEDMHVFFTQALPGSLAAFTFSCLVGWAGARAFAHW